MSAAAELVHATAVAVDGAAALIVGPSGAGKSDLALRILTAPFRDGARAIEARLVADDQVLIERRGDMLVARAPQSIAGLIEVRGLGVVAMAAEAEARLVLVVDITPGTPIERMPAADDRRLVAGIALPLLNLAPFEASAPAKVLLRLARLTCPPHRAP